MPKHFHHVIVQLVASSVALGHGVGVVELGAVLTF
jgi:hypothetical protein